MVLRSDVTAAINAASLAAENLGMAISGEDPDDQELDQGKSAGLLHGKPPK
jgi:hypothetical protein